MCLVPGRGWGCRRRPGAYPVSPLSARSTQVLVVEPPLRGVLLADLLERELPPTDRANLRQLIGEGSVRVNGEVVLANRRLRIGDVVQVANVDLPGRAKPPRALPEVVFESATALVVGKPAGVPVVPDRSGADRGLHGQFEALRPGADLRVVHRLDRDTSGCLLLAKGLQAAQHFDVQFREGLVHKRYVALVHGVPLQPDFSIDAWLGPDPKRPGKVVASPGPAPGFRQAHTAVHVRTALGQQALLELRPRTGRSHQLRVHLQSIGHPIVGDADYGGAPLLLSHVKRGYKQRPGVPERPLLARMFLHAEGLSFADVDGTQVSVDVPLPADLAMALQKLERFDEGRR